MLADVLDKVKRRPTAFVRAAYPPPPGWWDKAKKVLDQIPIMEYWADRGYFEWKHGFDQGAFPHPCDSSEFERFAHRVIDRQPQSFEELEEQF